MTKSKKIRRELMAWGQIIAIIVAAVTFYIMIDQRFDQVDVRLDGVDRRLDKVDGRLDAVDHRLESLEGKIDAVDHRLTKLENLVNLDLSWRYLYQNDPAPKHLRPIYYPDTKTLELERIP